MSADSDNLRQELVAQLSSFEERLESKIDDVRMLADIQEAVGRVIGADGGNEAEIRRILQERYEAGELRKETFQLVKSMLDRFVTEQVATSPGFTDKGFGNTIAANSSDALLARGEPAAIPPGDDSHSATMVLPADAQPGPETADERVQVGSVLRDRFLLQKRLSGGGMGVVYKALDRRLAEGGSLDHFVAIKVLSPHLAENADALRALQQEATKGRCLTHPNIVRCIDLDREDDLYFMVMEWLEGETLADILDSPNAKSIDQDRAFEIVEQIGKALEYAHRCGIVHADVKPGNIMIMPNGDAKLFDFGVARVVQKQLQQQPDFDPGVLGLMTPAYSSMQVLTGEKPTPADDVFSLACLLYRLIAGYRVFGPRNAAEAAEEGMKPQRLKNIGDTQWKALKKALSYSRVTRYQSMEEFTEALQVNKAEPGAVRISAPVRDELDVEPDAGGAGKYVAALILILGAAGGAAWYYGYLDQAMAEFGLPQRNSIPVADLIAPAGPVADEPVADEPAADAGDDSTEADTAIINDAAPIDAAGRFAIPDEPVADVSAEPKTDLQDGAETDSTAARPAVDVPVETGETPVAQEVIAEPEPVEPAEPAAALVDFTKLPPPTAEVQLAANGARPRSINVRLREDSAPVTVDLVRTNTAVPLKLRLEEVRHSGNRSPWTSGQFTLSGDGIVDFPVGQDRARVTLSMASDPLREADQQITLRVREADSASTELAVITAVLEDDDQRTFEATLPANTVGFATSQVTVREQDPAVQIDLIRFNPDQTTLQMEYAVRDITATQGEDYFAPGGYLIEFGPGQRSARILIPLVQDYTYEDNEAFSVELVTAQPGVQGDIYLRTAVMIRDDDL